MARKSDTPKVVPVDDYKERPLAEALADPEQVTAYENRQPDQIADYHQTHPTLKPSKAHDATPPVDATGDDTVAAAPGDVRGHVSRAPKLPGSDANHGS